MVVRFQADVRSEMQLALGDLLVGETQLQKDLDDAVDKAKDAVEASECQRIGFEDSAQLMFRRGASGPRTAPLLSWTIYGELGA